jgi:carboxyl-terminal processing protease
VYNDLTQQGALYFVFDVRNNTGGQLAAVQDILDYLLPRGPYVNCEKKSGVVALSANDTYEMTAPTVTLVNGSTIGEAELFAAVLQDQGKTRLVGTSTQGKAIVQEYATIQSDKGAVLLTTGVFSRLRSGDSWKDAGLLPDVAADLSYDKQLLFALLTDAEDTQLQAALEALKSVSYLPSATTTTQS